MNTTKLVNSGIQRFLASVILLPLLFVLPVVAETQAAAASVNEAKPQAIAGAKELRLFSSPQLRTRYYALMNELRCPKCQNQNLADSDAPIAADLRNELFSLLEEGYTDQQIRDFMTARYGTFVLYQPPLSGYTLALWLLPPTLLGFGALLVWRIVRNSQNDRSDALSIADKEWFAKGSDRDD